MTSALFIIGTVFDVLASLPDDSVDLVMTSPPFLALRSYLPADHPDKAKEIGSEATPGEFLDTLLDVIEACDRVLTPHGSMAIELGDTYSGSGGAGGDYNNGGLRQGQNGFTGSAHRSRHEQPRQWSGGPGWPLDKSKVLIPELFAIALSYGLNPLTGRQTDPWRVRNVVAWCRPNPPVGALGDKFRPATSYLTIACKARDRYFDADAVRQPLADSPGNRYVRKVSAGDRDGRTNATDGIDRETNKITKDYDPAASGGAPLKDYWEIPTQPFSGSHYATFPEALCVRPIESMCPRKVCTICGEPSRRIVDSERVRISDGTVDPPRISPTTYDAEGHSTAIGIRHAVETTRTTLGWTDCGHDSWRNGVVLDPFAGSGTTLMVATGHGRHAIGIDLDERNAELARERVGMWLAVEHLVPEEAP